MDPDPGGPKTYGSYRSGSATLLLTLRMRAKIQRCSQLASKESAILETKTVRIINSRAEKGWVFLHQLNSFFCFSHFLESEKERFHSCGSGVVGSTACMAVPDCGNPEKIFCNELIQSMTESEIKNWFGGRR